ncbi:uncharacterized protein LOC109861684 isoform X2 [Pseudomyrmex gracilis]|uniref:uncharacterized protein LOC109861684 isoform X2 n=1 Tax=Pseudomyrmex gracilis TaxID=219809 RepID=UPI000995C1A5|nr:uncharacterized protein LOC109861684 isoform X2 [Pseudomyrmex gracilis]
MRQVLNRLLFNRHIFVLSKDSKRFAGHSKWANIKHTKEKHDNERMMLFWSLKSQMKVAIQCGSTDPDKNLKLSQVIERAKKANMPVASIKSFLEKMEFSGNKTEKGLLEVHGPNGYIMLVSFTTDNPKSFTAKLNGELKKTRGKVMNVFPGKMFNHVGTIIVEKKDDLDKAVEDAISVGAEDVEEFEENNVKYFRFKCEPKLVSKIKSLLESLHYSVVFAEEEYVPKTVINLNESDLKFVSEIHNKVLNLSDVNCIYDNLI